MTGIKAGYPSITIETTTTVQVTPANPQVDALRINLLIKSTDISIGTGIGTGSTSTSIGGIIAGPFDSPTTTTATSEQTLPLPPSLIESTGKLSRDALIIIRVLVSIVPLHFLRASPLLSSTVTAGERNGQTPFPPRVNRRS